MNLEKLFNPKSIAIIGASANTEKVGHQILKNIIEAGFWGKVFPVNPHEEHILGYRCYFNVTKIPAMIDLAIIAVPAASVPDVLEECGLKNIPACIVISAGFKEIGGMGKKLEERITEIANENDIALVGPNCLGILNPHGNLNASFALPKAKGGSIAIISQSGALGSGVLDWAADKGIGFSKFISTGNQAVIDETMFLDFLANDPQTKSFILYVEAIKDNKKFLNKVKIINRGKPIVIIKGGRSSAGQRATSSHTGAMGSSSKIFTAAVRRAGAIMVDGIEEMFATLKDLPNFKPVKNNRVVILTNAGGPAVIATDLIARKKIKMAEFSDETIQALTSSLPKASANKNPVDLVGDAQAEDYKKALNILNKDKNFDSILVLLTPQTSTQIAKTAQVISPFNKKTKKFIVASFLGGLHIKKAEKILNKELPFYDFPDQALDAIERNYLYSLTKQKDWQKIVPKKFFIGKLGNKKLMANENLQSYIQVLKSYGIDYIETLFPKDEKDLEEAAEKLGYPMVAKTASSIKHKKSEGGVLMNICNLEELKDAYLKIKKFGQGVQLQPQINDGIELFFGAKNDPDFGKVISFGLGGSYIEIINELNWTILPLTKGELERLLHFKANLADACDIKKIKDLIIKLSQFFEDYKIQEMDINPIKATKDKILPIDLRIIL